MNHRMQASRSTPRPVSNIPPSYVQKGHILWLPKKRDISDQSLLNGVTLCDDAYDRPVVVLHTDPSAKRVTLTSRIPRNSVQQYRLPISPSPPNPLNGLQLHLDDGGELDKPSHVRIEKAYSIPWAIIRPDRSHIVYKLTQESFAILIRRYDPRASGPLPYSSLDDIENVIQTTIHRPAQHAQPAQPAQPRRARALQRSDPSQNGFRPASRSQRDSPSPVQTHPSHRFPGQRPTGPVRPPVHLRDPYNDYIRPRISQYEGAEPNIPWRLLFVLAGLGIAFFYYPNFFKRTQGFLVWSQERTRWIRKCLASAWDSLKALFTPATKAFRFLKGLCPPSTHHDALAWVQGSLRPKCQSLVLGLRGALDKFPSPVSFLEPLPEVPDNAFTKDLASQSEEIARGYAGRIGGFLTEKVELIRVWQRDGV
ncbi:MAG: hypothetical protein M1840_008965 [Geoglossum simile]|nr:MAG: hypothetical protein M1840_008965 [Geoglossum simile]